MSKDSKENEGAKPAEEEAEASAETPVEEAATADTPTTEENETGELLRKLDEATAEVTVQKERYLRTVADLENYRKRALREKEEARRQANCGLVEDLLPVLDNFRLGLKSAEMHEGGAAFAEGFRMILTQMETALKQNGLEEINPESGVFDPNYHEAVGHVPHDSIEDGHIVEVQRIGYRLHERLLRPAAVIISNGTRSKAQEAEGPETEEE
ncbi:MAG: nucleotide exchange factor GrpE [Oceanipulchritudo sp.]